MRLYQASRDYLRTLEDGSREDADRAKDHLAEIAILWAQGEAIAKVKSMESKYVTVGREELIARLESLDHAMRAIEVRAETARRTAAGHRQQVEIQAEHMVSAWKAEARAETYEMVLAILRGEPL